jgi:chromate transporter
MAKSLTPDWPRRGVALVTALLALLVPSAITQVALIALAATIGLARPAPPSQLTPPRRADLVWLGLFVALLIALPLLALTGDPTLTIVEKFYRTGSLVFGGGHVVLPLLEAELVTPGLIPRDLFLAGYGAAQAVPGPLFSFAAYTGALLTNPPNGLWGATLGLLAIYLPSFVLVFATLDWWQSLRRNTRLRNGLTLANAAVVGLLLATLYDPVATSSITAWPDLIWAAAALILLFRKFPPPLVVLLSALVGAGLSLI